MRHRLQLTELRSRLRVPLEGDVCQRRAPIGAYQDGWASGDLTFTVIPARDITAFSIQGTLPEGVPPDNSIRVAVGDNADQETHAVPERFSVRCDAQMQAGEASTIRMRTSTTVHHGPKRRDIGAFISSIRFDSDVAAPFTCNICAANVPDLEPNVDPEGSLCRACGSNIRQRALAHLVADTLYGEPLLLRNFPCKGDVIGLGISDSPAFAKRLKRALPGYENTQFDSALVSEEAPYLDIVNPAQRFFACADFITCSEVLEHVQPPVQSAFEGLYSLLKPGGTLILTVPYSFAGTIEHFPDLHEWHLENRDPAVVLVNRTRAGTLEEFRNLRFHGGGDAVLEMRVFGLEDIFGHLEAAGFRHIRVREENLLTNGIFFKYNWGLPITARRPL